VRIAITGASGLLGRALIETASSRHQIVAAFHSTKIPEHPSLELAPLDLTAADSILQFFDIAKPDLVIHSAAVTDVDLCEREPKLAQALNADATRQLVAATRGTTVRIIYVSTDYVFDGSAGPYTETDETHPINVYGRTKLEGEGAVLTAGNRHAIVRTAGFLGCGGPSRPTFVERMLETIRDHLPLRAASDQVSNITPVDELASGIMRLIESGATGIWHIAHPQIISRYDLGIMLARLAAADPSRIERINYDSLHRAARRPLRGGLKTEKASRDLTLTYRPLKESLALVLRQIESNSTS
jgi:dTDP-4-dehydrorhamnose reductase